MRFDSVLAAKVEAFRGAQEARDGTEQAVVKEMQRLGIEVAMVPGLKAVVHLVDAESDHPTAWLDTEVVVST